MLRRKHRVSHRPHDTTLCSSDIAVQRASPAIRQLRDGATATPAEAVKWQCAYINMQYTCWSKKDIRHSLPTYPSGSRWTLKDLCWD